MKNWRKKQLISRKFGVNFNIWLHLKLASSFAFRVWRYKTPYCFDTIVAQPEVRILKTLSNRRGYSMQLFSTQMVTLLGRGKENGNLKGVTLLGRHPPSFLFLRSVTHCSNSGTEIEVQRHSRSHFARTPSVAWRHLFLSAREFVDILKNCRRYYKLDVYLNFS